MHPNAKTLQVFLPAPDIMQLIDRPLKLVERGPTKKRVLQQVVNFVDTFIKGMAA